MKKLITILSLVFAFNAVADRDGIDLNHARNQGGFLLGTTKIDETTDRDVLNLPACFSTYYIGRGRIPVRVATGMNKPVSHLKLFVRQYPVQIDRLRVQFHNGQFQELQVKDHFKKNTSSRWIDLKGDKRCIKKIIVVGDTDTPRYAPNKRANLKFYGLK